MLRAQASPSASTATLGQPSARHVCSPRSHSAHALPGPLLLKKSPKGMGLAECLCCSSCKAPFLGQQQAGPSAAAAALPPLRRALLPSLWRQQQKRAAVEQAAPPAKCKHFAKAPKERGAGEREGQRGRRSERGRAATGPKGQRLCPLCPWCTRLCAATLQLWPFSLS